MQRPAASRALRRVDAKAGFSNRGRALSSRDHLDDHLEMIQDSFNSVLPVALATVKLVSPPRCRESRSDKPLKAAGGGDGAV